ncbi:hypothetical protein [Pseudomonas tohonis]|uniref:Uncharacterized protein n=1 Tax=Pseudomonas tohonis TaxID=2725477 RepID=A0ABQ4VSY2_9PSED|nr:hypothetical protein [Pseudomonas tohonis]GJN50807.1 hypothetical protein TUM20286_05590 [Pseudomonas tohonis]
MLSTGCIRNHQQQVAMLGSAAGIDPERFPRRYALAKARGELKKYLKDQSLADRQPTPQERRYEEAMAKLPKIRELAQRYAVSTVAEMVGIDRKRLALFALDHGIEFQDGRNKEHLERYAVYGEKLQAYLAIGMTRLEARRASRLTDGVFLRVCKHFNIVFPEKR